MNVLRSLLYLLILLIVTPPYTLGVLFFAPLPHRWRRQSVVPWVSFTNWLIKHVLGIRYRLEGVENLPTRPVVVMCKHQSAWETFAMQEIFRDTVFVWKKEIKRLPFFGWALAVTPSIAIDRSGGMEALRDLVAQGKERLAQGYTVIIFPEGTRAAPGEMKRFLPGGARLATAAGVPVIPVAINSGEFWGRNALFKRPGTITVSIGPAIDPSGLKEKEINQRAASWIAAEMQRISPQHSTGASHESQPESPTRPAT